MTLAPSEHAAWALSAERMTERIQALLPDARIEHIGSTSVPDLPAKPVVDLAVGVPSNRIRAAARVLVAHGFDLEGEQTGHSWLSSPHRRAREHVIHVFELGGRAWLRRLRFRDILRTDADARERYLAVKQQSAATSAGWDDYTLSKTAIVHEILGD